MKSVLTVLEYGGSAAQDQVRGQVFKKFFDRDQVVIDYAGRHPAGLRKLTSSKSRLLQEFTASFEYKVLVKADEYLRTWLNDLHILRIANRYDAIHLIKVSSLDLIQKLRSKTSARLVYDLGDALWQPYYAEVYGDINKILAAVDAVTCDNAYGLEYAARFNPSVFIWPTISQVEKFDLHRGSPKSSLASGMVTLGWVGGYDTAFNLFEIWEVLEHVFQKYQNIYLRLLGVGRNYRSIPPFENVRFSVLPGYNSAQMVEEVLKMDIGLFPMFDVENSRVRGILKALIYMSGEAAVIGSPRGDMVKLIEDGKNGYLANSTQEWIQKLGHLIENSETRARFAQAALETVRTQYTIEQSYDCLKKALQF